MPYVYRGRDGGGVDRLRASLGDRARAESGRGMEPTAAIIDPPRVKTTQSVGPRGEEGEKKGVGCPRPIAVGGDGAAVVVEGHAVAGQARDGAAAVCVKKRFAESGDAGPRRQETLQDLGEWLRWCPRPREPRD